LFFVLLWFAGGGELGGTDGDATDAVARGLHHSKVGRWIVRRMIPRQDGEGRGSGCLAARRWRAWIDQLGQSLPRRASVRW
jgi:hypothetical protein